MKRRLKLYILFSRMNQQVVSKLNPFVSGQRESTAILSTFLPYDVLLANKKRKPYSDPLLLTILLKLFQTKITLYFRLSTLTFSKFSQLRRSFTRNSGSVHWLLNRRVTESVDPGKVSVLAEEKKLSIKLNPQSGHGTGRFIRLAAISRRYRTDHFPFRTIPRIVMKCVFFVVVPSQSSA